MKRTQPPAKTGTLRKTLLFAASLIIPGLGQLFQKQWWKALFFFILTLGGDAVVLMLTGNYWPWDVTTRLAGALETLRR